MTKKNTRRSWDTLGSLRHHHLIHQLSPPKRIPPLQFPKECPKQRGAEQQQQQGNSEQQEQAGSE